MKRQYLTTLAVVIAVMIGISVHGCKKKESVREDTAPTGSVDQEPTREDSLSKQPISLDNPLYKHTRIAFESFRDGNWDLYVMNPDGSEQKRLTNHSAWDGSPAWSPDGQKIAFVSEDETVFDIYVTNLDGSAQRNLTNNRSNNRLPSWLHSGKSWSPDGQKIAFASFVFDNNMRQSDIYVMNPDGSEQRNLTTNRTIKGCPSWSPDGQRIAFCSRTSSRNISMEIYVMNPDGSEQRNLTNNPTWDQYPSWSPDGQKIAFYSNRDGNFEIYIMNADGSKQRNVTNDRASDWSPSWSPDGQKIAFISNRDGNWDIYVMNPDGSEQKRLTDNPADESEQKRLTKHPADEERSINHPYNPWSPSWSPDGKKIAFYSNRNGNQEIYVMNPDGSEQRNLTNNHTDDRFPLWSPFLPSEEKE